MSFCRTACVILVALLAVPARVAELPAAAGFRGVWYIVGPTRDEFAYKSSGHGSLVIAADGWRVVASTDPGPRPHGTGGEMVRWESKDQGKTWTRVAALTATSPRNHTYARRPLAAHPGFDIR